jgi:hypothetical protein
MITADLRFSIDESGIIIYAATNTISVSARLSPDGLTNVGVEINVINTDGAAIGSAFVSFASSSVDTYTPTGSDSTEDYFNQIEQKTVDYLDALTPNSAVTFSIV